MAVITRLRKFTVLLLRKVTQAKTKRVGDVEIWTKNSEAGEWT